jgi:very-short-patch-repair endonuclease
MKSELEETLALFIRVEELPEPEREYRFHPTRRWRFDFAYPEYKIGIECEGGTWAGGRHVRGGGYSKDLEKYNTATEIGWRIVRFTKDMIDSGDAIETIKRLLKDAPND